MINLYSDQAGQHRVEEIAWDANFLLKLVTGEKAFLENTSEAGQLASAIVYLKNEGRFRFGVTELIFHDDRVKFDLEDAWLIPHIPIRLTVKFVVPEIVTPQDVVKSGIIHIKGFYVYGE